MRVFTLAAAFLVAIPLLAAEAGKAELRGRLLQGESGAVSIQTPAGPVEVAADKDTLSVLRDPRLAPYEVMLDGHFTDGSHFSVNPFFTSPIRAMQKGKAVHVSYWCAVCSIRSYTPGRCLCCQAETDLDFNWDKDTSAPGKTNQ